MMHVYIYILCMHLLLNFYLFICVCLIFCIYLPYYYTYVYIIDASVPDTIQRGKLVTICLIILAYLYCIVTGWSPSLDFTCRTKLLTQVLIINVFFTYIYTIYTPAYIYMCVCMCRSVRWRSPPACLCCSTRG